VAYPFHISLQYRYVEEMDAGLLARARLGDEAAFLRLYGRHRTPAFRFAWRLTASSSEAEDIVQECFLALLGRDSFDARQGSLRTYIFGIVRHLAWKRSRLMERESEEVDDRAAAIDPLRDLLDSERAGMVERAVAALAPLQREALILFEYEELSLEEIAAITGAEVGAVKARLFLGPGMVVAMVPEHGRLRSDNQPMEWLAGILASQLGSAVIDATGLKGRYDFVLSWAWERDSPGGPVAASADSLIREVQSQLGLRLDRKKGQAELLVVDHMEKTPTEN
jgi:RNA polymerase sigma-70 factor (ECF subfamily)